MKKNRLISFTPIIVVLIVLGFLLFNDPNQGVRTQEKEIERELDNSLADNVVGTIEFLNLQGENRKLKAELESLNNQLFDNSFELIKIILTSDSIYDIFPYHENTEIIYKNVTDTEYTIFYKDETGYNLRIASKVNRLFHFMNFDSLEPGEPINSWGGNFGNLAKYYGFITDTNIQSVQVKQNELIHKAEIIKINESTNVWYCIFEAERKSIRETPDKMKIQALDKEGNIIFEESVVGNLG